MHNEPYNYSEKLKKERFNEKEGRSEPGKELEGMLEETERDRGRITQSSALRRLQQKTQVYPLETNAAVRSRLTHSLEVQQIGRFLARKILSELEKEHDKTIESKEHDKTIESKEHDKTIESKKHDDKTAFMNIVEMGCLLHDIGNPPFGHFGEQTISKWLSSNLKDLYTEANKSNEENTEANKNNKKISFNNTLLPDLETFEGNAQGIRIIHHLQNLNLTYSQIACLLKYTISSYKFKKKENELLKREKKPGFYFSEEELINKLWEKLSITPGNRFPLTYIMEAADDIAYCIADLEDAIDKDILSISELKKNLEETWDDKISKSEKFKDKANNLFALLPDKSKKSDEPEKETPPMVAFRAELVHLLIKYASKKYIDNHHKIFNGTFDEPLISGDSYEPMMLKTLKEVAIKYVFSDPVEVKTPELIGYAALNGLFDIFKPLLKMPKDDFESLIKGKEIKAQYFIEQRLFQRLSKKYIDCYEKSLHSLQEKSKDLEWYYRVRLVIDYISGMTDHFVVTEYQKLSAISQ